MCVCVCVCVCVTTTEVDSYCRRAITKKKIRPHTRGNNTPQLGTKLNLERVIKSFLFNIHLTICSVFTANVLRSFSAQAPTGVEWGWAWLRRGQRRRRRDLLFCRLERENGLVQIASPPTFLFFYLEHRTVGFSLSPRRLLIVCGGYDLR